MAHDQRSHYFDTRQRVVEATERAEAVVNRVVSFAEALRSGGWRQVDIANVFIPNMTTATFSPSARTIDGNAWPSVKDLAEAIATWRKATDEMVSAWKRIPPEQQKGLPAPDH